MSALAFIPTQPFELEIFYKLVLAFIVGGVIGYTRTASGKPAGMRTQMLLCIGSTLLTAISIHLKDMYYSPNADPARLMAQIVTGIGFVGGGVILKSDRKVIGVTTAAMIWVTAAIGIAIGTGLYFVSLAMLGFVLLLEPIAKLQFMIGLKSKPYKLTIPVSELHHVLNELEKHTIQDVEQKVTKKKATLLILSSRQRNEDLEATLNADEVPFTLEKVVSQDFVA